MGTEEPMSLSRRAVLAVVAGGVLSGCASTGGTPHALAASTDPPPAASPDPPAATGTTSLLTRQDAVAHYGGLAPTYWGLDVPGAVSRLPSGRREIALTFDACGGRGGSGYDEGLISFLRDQQVPATLFLNSRWIEANPAVFLQLATDPLFEIGNHGTRHLPLSVTGRSAYHIPGTRDVGEVYDEVAGNQAKLTGLLGHPPRFFRSGTAFCDDVAARVVGDLGERFVSFDVNGDGGATFTPEKVHQAVLAAGPGSIVISRMNHPEGGTARGMRSAVPRLLAKEYRFVRLSDALG
jgi:peptidoglycan/xylan/chitin deacetylase (PgdA/CDA1 family)